MNNSQSNNLLFSYPSLSYIFIVVDYNLFDARRYFFTLVLFPSPSMILEKRREKKRKKKVLPFLLLRLSLTFTPASFLSPCHYHHQTGCLLCNSNFVYYLSNHIMPTFIALSLLAYIYCGFFKREDGALINPHVQNTFGKL